MNVVLFYLFSFLAFFIFILASVAFMTFFERKNLAGYQSRKGPNKVGKFGFFQPVIDGIKLLLKETIAPVKSFKVIFFLSCIYAFFIGLSFWIVFPVSFVFINSNLSYGILFVFMLSIKHVYAIILAGWSSNSHYSFLGAMRCSAQLIAYDVTMILVLLHVYLWAGSLNILKIVEYQFNHVWFVIIFPFIFLIFLVCALAETNRHPFDLPEAEAELVSGYNVEYSAMSFSLFSLGEYSSILFMSSFTVNFFFGGWDMFGVSFISSIFLIKIICGIFYILKIFFFCYLFVHARGLIPRYKYNQLLRIGWTYMLPFVFLSLIYNIIIIYIFS